MKKRMKIGFVAGEEKNEDCVEIVCVVDKSGSMASRAADAIGGFNAFLEKQKKLPGRARFTLALFDSPGNYHLVHDGVELQEVAGLTVDTYVPGGNTALLDAVGETLTAMKKRLGDRKPKDVIFMVLTDGEENSSREYTLRGVRAMIEERARSGWEFHYLGADVDGFAAAQSLQMPYKGFRGHGSVSAHFQEYEKAVSRKRGIPEDPPPAD